MRALTWPPLLRGHAERLVEGRLLLAGDVDEVVQNCLARYEARASGEFYPPMLAEGNRAVLGKM